MFRQEDVPRDPFEKLDDAARVHAVTGVAPIVSLHIPWDRVGDYAALAAYAGERGLRLGESAPADQGAMVRCILESLALAHRRALRTAAELAGRDIAVVHMVGGGSRNELLCRLTADATGLPVVAGPTEATALGNILVQARAHKVVGDVADMRRLIADTQHLRHYRPRGDQRDRAAAAARIGLD